MLRPQRGRRACLALLGRARQRFEIAHEPRMPRAPAHVIDAIERVRMPFNVNLTAQAVAIAALEDDAFTDESLAHNDRELARLRSTWVRPAVVADEVRSLAQRSAQAAKKVLTALPPGCEKDCQLTQVSKSSLKTE